MHNALSLFILILSLPLMGIAQDDSIDLICPLQNGSPRIIRASDKNYEKSSEYGVMITSKTDTLVQAVHSGQVVIVARTDDKHYDVVILYRGYYFWYAGVLSPRVRVGTNLKSGDIIGNYNPGDMLELLMFYREEPVNPRKHLKCG